MILPINFLEVDDVLAIHRVQLREFGGADGIRDPAALSSAVMQPQQTWAGRFLYPTVFDMAAVYAHGIAQAQAFVDGNKRTALQPAVLFLKIN